MRYFGSGMIEVVEYRGRSTEARKSESLQGRNNPSRENHENQENHGKNAFAAKCNRIGFQRFLAAADWVPHPVRKTDDAACESRLSLISQSCEG